MSHGVGGSAPSWELTYPRVDDSPFPNVGYVIVEGPPKIKMSPKNGAVSEFCKEMLT